MFRPPGLVERIETKVGIKNYTVPDHIINTIPTAKLYRRGKPEEKKDERKEPERNLYDKNNKDKDNIMFKKVEELLMITLK